MAEQETPRQPSFGTVLRQLRHDAGMSLTDLSLKINYSRGYISKVETGAAPANEAFARRCDHIFATAGALAALVRSRTATTPRAARRTTRRPFDLPPAAAHFTGRDDDLDAVCAHGATDRDHRSAAPVTLIHGMPGVGKTALVIQAAHRLRSAYPDGCLFLDLSTHHASTASAAVTDALDRLLRRLGVPGEAVPAHVAERGALYRSLLHDRRVLIVLDNARRADHVTPLIPATRGCRVLVTSRRALPALDDVQSIRLAPLTAATAADLFRHTCGNDRLSAQTNTDRDMDRLVSACAGLPLAIRTAAARYRATPRFTLHDFARRLSDPDRLLSTLDDGERSVHRVLAAACTDLPPQRRRLLAELARHPGPSITHDAASWITALPADHVAELLDRLHQDNLLEARSEGTFAFHDLIRACAATLDTVTSPDVTVDRLVNAYVRAAHAADATLTPYRHRPPPPAIGEPPPTMVFTGPDEAYQWCERELTNIVAVCQLAWKTGRDQHCWQLAYAMRGYFFIAKTYQQWTAVHRIALRASRRSEDRWAEAVTRNNLGLSLIEQRRAAAAETQYRAALTLFTRLGDRHGQAATLGHQAWAQYLNGHLHDGLAMAESAAALYEQLNDPRGRAITERTRALILAALGHHQDAITHLATAASTFETLASPVDVAMTFNCLGEVHLQTGNLRAARRCHRQAADISRAAHSAYELARATDGMAVARTTGDATTTAQLRHGGAT